MVSSPLSLVRVRVLPVRDSSWSSVLSSSELRSTVLPSAISRLWSPLLKVRVWSSAMVVSSRNGVRSITESGLSPLPRVRVLPLSARVWSSAMVVSVSSSRKLRSMVSSPSSLVRVRVLPVRLRAWLSMLVSSR